MKLAILSRDPSLYSTRRLREEAKAKGFTPEVLDVLSLELRVGTGCYYQGKKLTPHFTIPRLSGAYLLSGLAVIRELEASGTKVLNHSTALETTHDQLRTLQVLSQHGLPFPETRFCSQPHTSGNLEELSQFVPSVYKLLESAQGLGVTLIKDSQTASGMLTTLATLKSSGIIQHFHEDAWGEDLRLFVLNGKVIAGMKRTAQTGEFRANLHRGAKAEAYTPTPHESALAIKSCAALGLNCGGVDLIQTNDGTKVLEVNASAGLEGIEHSTGINIAQAIINYAYDAAKG